MWVTMVDAKLDVDRGTKTDRKLDSDIVPC